MLKDEEVVQVAKNFAQYQRDFEYAQVAQNQASISWDEVIRSLKTFDPEDGDRERIIEECRRLGKASPALVKSVHKAFDMLGIVAKRRVKENPTRRETVIKVAVDQALGKTGGRKIRNPRLDAAIEIERQLEKGREARAIDILKAKLWEAFDRAGRLIRDHYDLMSIEEAATYFNEEYVAAWHATHDEGVEKEKAKAKANGTPNA